MSKTSRYDQASAIQREISESVRLHLDLQLTNLQQRIDIKNEKLRAKIEQKIKAEVQNGIEGEVRLRMKYLALFAAGFLVFVTIGMLQRESLFKPVVKYVYPPQEIYQNIEPDVQLGVWKTMKTGDRARFIEVLNNGHFYPALMDTFRKDVIEKFGTVESRKKVTAQSVMFFGEMSIPARITTIDKRYQGKGTTCHRLVDHSKPQAIVVLPRDATEADYRWFGCTPNYPELTELKLVIDGQRVEGVQLIGVERGGPHSELEVRISAAVAESLNLEGYLDFSSFKFGKVSINRAED